MRQFILVSIFVLAVISICSAIESISLSGFYKGVLLDSLEVDFITDSLTDTLQNVVDVNDVISPDKSCFIAYISPNVCGSCERHSLDLVNRLAQEFPGQVAFIIQNSYFKEAIKTVRKYQFEPSIRIYFDPDGNNIYKFSKLNTRLFNMWQIVVDSNNHVVCLRALDYNQKITKEHYQQYINKINSLLSN